MKRPARIIIVMAAAVGLAACGSQSGTVAPNHTLTPAEKQIAVKVTARGQVCLRQLQVMHPVTSLRTGVGPCMASLVPPAQRKAFEAELLASARADRPWHKLNRPGWYNDLAVWVEAHGGNG